MAQAADPHSPPKLGLREAWSLAVFAYRALIAPWPPFVVFLVVLAIVSAVTPVVMVYATTGLIDAVTQRVGIDGAERPFFELVAPFLPWVGLLLVLRLVEHLIQADPFSRYLSLHLGLRSMRRLEAWVFGKAVALRLEWFEYPRYYDTLQRATEAMDEQWQSWSLLQIKNLIANAFALAGILFALSGIHWGVPLIMLAGTAILVAGHAFQSKRYVDVNFSQTPTRRRKEYWGKLLTERTAAAEVRLFGLTRHILSSWLRTTEQMLREKAATRVRNLPVGVPAILASLGLFGVVIFALILAAEAGTVTAGGVVAYLYITQQYIRRVSDLGWRTRQAQQFLAELRYMPEFLNLEREERRDGSAAPAKLARGIRFEGVSFTYPGSEEPALSEVDLEIRPEERVALIGENGAGKTTLTKLLLGLYEPTDGRITVDGTDPAGDRPRLVAGPGRFGLPGLHEVCGHGAREHRLRASRPHRRLRRHSQCRRAQRRRPGH